MMIRAVKTSAARSHLSGFINDDDVMRDISCQASKNKDYEELHKKALEEVKCDKVFADMIDVNKTTQKDKQNREGSGEKRLVPIKNTHEYDDEDDDSSIDASDLTSVDDDGNTGFFEEADSEDYISDDDDGLIINKDDDGLIINKVDGLTDFDFDEFRRNIPTDDVYDSDSADSNSSDYHSDSSEFEEGLEGEEFIMTPSLAAHYPRVF